MFSKEGRSENNDVTINRDIQSKRKDTPFEDRLVGFISKRVHRSKLKNIWLAIYNAVDNAVPESM